MSLETGNYISALVRTNPLSSDPVSEGDDHLQLIKKVLQKTFPMGTDADGSTSGVGPGQAVQVLIAKSSAPTISGTAAESMGLLWLDISDAANPILKIRNVANDAWITLPVDPNANNTVDINAGTIDGTVIGGATPAAGDFTTLATTGALTVGTDITISGDDIIMATNTDAYLLIADGTSYNPTAISGDVTITNAGVVTIGADKVTASKISFIDDSLAVTDTHIMIADGTDYNNKALSGDVTMTNTGAVTIADNAVTLAKQADGTQGGIIYYGGSGAPTELAAGTSGYVLSTAGSGANPAWVSQDTVGGSIKLEELEDVAGTPSNDQYLKYSTSASPPEWQMVSIVGDDKLTTKGDLLVYNTVDSETRYGIADSSYPGTDGYALTALAAATNGVAWQPVTVADGAITNAKLADMDAGTVKVRDAGDSGVPSDLALATTEILVGDGAGVAAVSLSGDATMTNAGVVSIGTGVIVDADVNASAAIDATKIADGSVTSTEFQYINTLSSNAQTQINAKGVGDAVKADDAAWTGSQRATPVTDNDGSYDLDAGQNFITTPSGDAALTFTTGGSDMSSESSLGQSGFIKLINSGGHAISIGTAAKADANLATTVTTAGTYLLSYFSDGTDVWLTNSAIYA